MKKLVFIVGLFLSITANSQGLKALLLCQGCTMPVIEDYTGGTSMQEGVSVHPIMPDPYSRNDILILVAGTRNGENFSTPTGWTALGSITNDSLSVNLFWKRATEDGSGFSYVEVSTTSSSKKIGYIMRFSCVGTSTTPTATMLGTGHLTGSGGSVTASKGQMAIMLWLIDKEGTATKTAGTGWYGGVGTCSGSTCWVDPVAIYEFDQAETSSTVSYSWGTENKWSARMYIILEK